ncbi:uncharacterized protein LOC143236626 isoform X1 [Tachypleus tridentatus]|uniref:uncharacterized protein LOC143236626 isoform X1 n=1 Tax=Tachypleus tridentatus TaxID=6853 RepID=UPI003FCFE908
MPFQGLAATGFTYFDFQNEAFLSSQLHLLALKGNTENLKELVQSGKVYVDSQDQEGTTALILACANNNFQCAKELLKHGANPAARRVTGTSALYCAAQGGYLDIVNLLLEHGAPVNVANWDGGTPLMVASQCNHSDVVKALVTHGGNIEARMLDKATPLFVAAQNGHTETVSLLISLGACVDARRTDGATPLWIACQMGHYQVLEELIVHNAQIDCVNEFIFQDGATPLFKASHKGYLELVELLVRNGASLGLLKNGESCLHAAALFDHLKVVKFLISAGADPHLRSQDGVTPLELAQEAQNVQVVNYLKRFSKERKLPDVQRSS